MFDFGIRSIWTSEQRDDEPLHHVFYDCGCWQSFMKWKTDGDNLGRVDCGRGTSPDCRVHEMLAVLGPTVKRLA